MLRKIMTLAALSLSAIASPELEIWNGCMVEVHNTKIIQGEAALLTIKGVDSKPLPPLKVTFLNQVLSQGLVPSQEHTAYYFLPVDYYTKPGTYTLRIEDTHTDAMHRMPVRVMAGTYPKETLSVDPAFTKLAPEVEARTEREAKMVAQLYASYQPYDHRLKVLVFPLTSAITSKFGGQRLFNHEVKSYHNGIDFRAQVGAPITAAAEGRILLAENLFYSGNHVSIDHGAGVVTTYSHLSKITVKTGDHVKAGDTIGLAGRTGRVTGPHLHWVIKLNSVTVNPVQAKALLQSITTH